MQFNIKNYHPINYRTWDFSGKGKNIKPLLSDIEKKIWNLALPYQDTRKGELGHGEFVTYFALKLTNILRGERKIVIPAAILHDIGWSQLTKVEHELFYESAIDTVSELQIWQRYEPILRARHQEQGVILGKRILKKVAYQSKIMQKILEINSEHDTRKEFLNLNDGIMRDADKLWRYSVLNFKVWIEERKKTLEQTNQFFLNEMSQRKVFYSDISKEIVKIELENTVRFMSKI